MKRKHRLVKQLPQSIPPGIKMHDGHHVTAPDDPFCNMNRTLNLHRPERVHLASQRRVGP